MSSKQRPRTLAWGLVCLLACGLMALRAMDGGGTPLRVAMSDKLAAGINMNDARAAFLVWGQQILGSSGFRMASSDFVIPSDQLLAAARNGTVDLFVMSVAEYRLVKNYVNPERIITDDRGGDELLLVVRNDSGINQLSDLRGRSLGLFESPTIVIAEPWLNVILWRDKLPGAAQTLKQVVKRPKLSQVVLPVFFGQLDACVVTRRSLDVMVEMNPQLGQKLKVLETSPPLISAFFVCRKSFPMDLQQRIINHLIDRKSTASTRQVLTLFQTPGNYAVWNEERLHPTMALLDTYEKHLRSGGR